MTMTTAVARCRPGLLMLAGLFLLVGAGAAFAVESIGSVARAVQTIAVGKGEVHTGDAVFVGDEFAVGRSGTLTILFNDESVLTLTPGSRAKISPGAQKGSKKRGAASFVIQLNGRYRWTPGNTLGQGSVTSVNNGSTFTPFSSSAWKQPVATSGGNASAGLEAQAQGGGNDSPGSVAAGDEGSPSSPSGGSDDDSSPGYAGTGGSGGDPGQPLVFGGGTGGGNWIPSDDGDGGGGNPFLNPGSMPGGSGGAPGGGNWIPADDAMTSSLASGTVELGATLDAGSLGLDSSTLNIGSELNLGESLAIDSSTATIGEVGITGVTESLGVTETLQVDSGVALDAVTLDGISTLDSALSVDAVKLDAVDSSLMQVDSTLMMDAGTISTFELSAPVIDLGGTSTLLEGTKQLAVPGM